MEVSVNRVLRQEPQDTIVSFSTLYGDGHGRWLSARPDVGALYDVELSIDETLVWGETVALSPDATAMISADGEKVSLQGALELVFPHGIAVLRLGPSTISFFATGIALPLGSAIRLHTQVLSLSDTNL